MSDFSYASEKGFDVGSAAWTELDDAEGNQLGIVDTFLDSIQPPSPFDETRIGAEGQLRLTLGYIVLLPMPDFSMPFNVIALSVTAVTFWFGSIFRLTASGRVPHWVLKKGELPGDSFLKKTMKRLFSA